MVWRVRRGGSKEEAGLLGELLRRYRFRLVSARERRKGTLALSCFRDWRAFCEWRIPLMRFPTRSRRPTRRDTDAAWMRFAGWMCGYQLGIPYFIDTRRARGNHNTFLTSLTSHWIEQNGERERIINKDDNTVKRWTKKGNIDASSNRNDCAICSLTKRTRSEEKECNYCLLSRLRPLDFYFRRTR